MFRNKRIIYLCLAACLITAAAYGRVFLRWGASGNPTKFTKSIGGEKAYKADVTINGGKGEVTVYSLLDDISNVAKKYKRSMDFKEWAWNGGDMAIGALQSDGMHCRVLIASMPGSAQTLVFLFEQTEQDALLSEKSPKEHLMSEIPPYPSSLPKLFVKDNKTATELAVASTSADKLDVYDFYNSSLKASGWSAAFSSKNGATPNPQSLKLYLKKTSLCCLFVDDSDKSGANRITLLHKQRPIK